MIFFVGPFAYLCALLSLGLQILPQQVKSESEGETKVHVAQLSLGRIILKLIN